MVAARHTHSALQVLRLIVITTVLPNIVPMGWSGQFEREKKKPAGAVGSMMDRECLKERMTNAGTVGGRKVGQRNA